MAAPHPALVPLLRHRFLPAGTKVTAPVVASAEEHGVAALLDGVVTSTGIDVDAATSMRLAMATLSAQAENAAALHAIGRVIDAADGTGVQVGFFKGPTIGARFYDDAGRRPSVDVDVFVAPGDVARIGELAGALGVDAETRETLSSMAATSRVFEHSIPIGNCHVDLHRDPMNMVLPTKLINEAWSSSITVELADGTFVKTLDLEWTILQALIHAFRDNFADLLHILDVGMMSDAMPDWGRVEAIADDEGWTDIIRFAAAFVGEVLDIDIPIPRLVTRRAKLLIERLWPRQMLLQGADSLVRSQRRQSAVDLLRRDRLGAVTSAYAARLLPPRSVIDLRFGPSDDPYPVALARWRRTQRRAIITERTRVEETPQP